MREISEDIIQRAARGDVDAFEAIYRAYSGFVCNVAFRIVNKREDAEEVTQEVFILIYRKLKSFRFQSSLKTWIYRITVNTAINMSKKWNKERKHMTEYNDQLNSQVLPSGVQNTIGQEYHENLIVQLLGSLNAEQRECVVLRNMEQLSYLEIAQTLNININTVRSRLKRAREALLLLKKEVMINEM